MSAPSSAPASPLIRWLPTLLGAALAGGVALVYALRPAPDCDCEGACEDDGARDGEVSPPRSRDAWVGPSRGAGSREPGGSEDEPTSDDRLAALEAQAAVLAERAVTGELTYYGQSQAELEAMARHCDVRTDYPTRLDEQALADLDLDTDEREAYQRAIEAFAAEEADFYRSTLRELAPDTAGIDELPLLQLRKQLTLQIARARRPEDEALRRAIAEERAGLRAPPEDPTSLSIYARYNRHRYDAGDRFARALERELGAERSEELRRAMGGWPGARTR
ncbi:MAG: hypothetical protein KC457_26575, partial [Myxococcales bacterium]|nr:hypothetical protein [Myxococcales bacterium]